MVPSVRVIGVSIWGSGWWVVLTHNIGMLSHHIPYRRNSGAVLSLVLSGLTNETRLVRHRCLSHCLHLMVVSHFKLLQPFNQGG